MAHHGATMQNPVFPVPHDPSQQTEQPAAVRTVSGLLGAGLVLLGAAVAAVAVLGPLVSGVLRNRTSPTSLNQIIGGDAAALAVVAPATIAIGVLAIRDHPAGVQYLSSPTAFWLVKFMDLGIVVPAALAVGIGALRHRQWARKPMYTLVGAYTLIGASVTGMAITMAARDDPDASATIVAGSRAAVACYLYRRLLRLSPMRRTVVER